MKAAIMVAWDYFTRPFLFVWVTWTLLSRTFHRKWASGIPFLHALEIVTNEWHAKLDKEERDLKRQIRKNDQLIEEQNKRLEEIRRNQE